MCNSDINETPGFFDIEVIQKLSENTFREFNTMLVLSEGDIEHITVTFSEPKHINEKIAKKLRLAINSYTVNLEKALVPEDTKEATNEPAATHNLLAETQYAPIIKVPPRYPTQAAKEGIEGYVAVQFSIAENGSVTNAKVLRSEPERVFDPAALKSLKYYKYRL